MAQTKNVFVDLNSVNVNEHVEQKNTGKATLSYLSWAWAWAEVKKRYPDAHYEILKTPQGLPYFDDPRCGIMVYTTVTIDGVTHEMWLPVMDGANNAMKFEPYSIKTKFGDKPVAAATMFDVNKTIMRCLTKNLAMFGLGLYIYAGEDLPEETEDEKQVKQTTAKLVQDIDALVKTLTFEMDTEKKRTFANEIIVPIIGQVNYKACTDNEKLQQLVDRLKLKFEP